MRIGAQDASGTRCPLPDGLTVPPERLFVFAVDPPDVDVALLEHPTRSNDGSYHTALSLTGPAGDVTISVRARRGNDDDVIGKRRDGQPTNRAQH